MNILAALVLLSGLFLEQPVYAINPEKPVTEYVHDLWQTENGLPQNSVTQILQAHDGYLWIGTLDGLVQFDGVKFKVFDKGSYPEIKSNRILALYEDHAGDLWIGTQSGGLMRFRNQKFTTYTTQDGLSDDIVNSIYEDRNHSILLGTPKGLNQLKGGKITLYGKQDGVSRDFVSSFKEDRDGNLWFGTLAGLCKMRGGKIIRYTTADGLSSNGVKSIVLDREGTLWVGTDQGLDRFVNEKFIRVLSGVYPFSLSVGRDNTIWVGLWGGGLRRIHHGTVVSITSKDGLSNDFVWSLFEDREGSLWVGTNGGGLNRFKDGKFSSWSEANGLSNNFAWTVYEDRKGSLWIGTASGLNRVLNGKVTVYTTKDGLNHNDIRSLFEDREGTLWIGSIQGLNYFKEGRFYKIPSLSGKLIRVIRQSRDGTLWIGTNGAGLARLRDGEITFYTTQEGYLNDIVSCIEEARDGSLWLGTWGGGLHRWIQGKIVPYTTESAFAKDIIRAFLLESDGTLWLGTEGNGLRRFRNGTFTTFTTRDGLLDDVVSIILEDSKGNFWMNCKKGICRVAKQELNDLAEGKVRHIHTVSYGSTDGLKNRESVGGGQPPGWKSRDGAFWFPTIQGVVRIDPEHLETNQNPPPVYVEQVLLDNKDVTNTVEAQGEAALGPGKERLEFRFTGLSFLAPEKMEFRYKLEGFDAGWTEAGSQRVAYYTNTPPGHYTFRVTACNNDGIWNLTGARFSFYQKPQFYQTYWFYLLCALLAVSSGWALHRLRLNQIQARFAAVLAERNRIAREIHDSLAQGLTGIAARLEATAKLLVQEPEEAKEHLDRARDLAQSSLADARRFVWELRPHELEDSDLSTSLVRFGKRLFAGTTVQVQAHISGASRSLQSSIETNLLRIGQEALTNAAKHAQAHLIEIDLSYETSRVRLKIKDDGCGFDVDRGTDADRNFGLIGIRERVEQLGGQLRIQSASKQGTEIEVLIPTK